MQSVKWVAFGLSSALTRTVVHFYPSEGGVTAPYPAACALRIFGGGLPDKRVVIEGARLSHPDGLRAEDAFPVLKGEQVGLFGLEIELSTTQPRVDMEGSRCVVELSTKGFTARFWPRKIQQLPLPHMAAKAEAEATTVLSRSVPLVKDSYGTSSIIMVNGSSATYVPVGKMGSAGSSSFTLPSLNGLSCAEIAPDDGIFNAALPLECSWGLVRARSLYLEEISPYEPCGVFIMHRDALTRRPVSVVAI